MVAELGAQARQSNSPNSELSREFSDETRNQLDVGRARRKRRKWVAARRAMAPEAGGCDAISGILTPLIICARRLQTWH
jgi:hypothetical protein